MWLFMILLHASAGVAAFVVAVVALRPPRARRHPWMLELLAGLLVALVVFMVGAMVAHWSDLDGASQVVFTCLVGLGGYMVYRAVHARRLMAAPPPGAMSRYVGDVGFVMIALFEGFVIVAAIDLGAQVLAVVAIAVVGLVAGTRVVGRAKDSAGAG